MTRDGTGQGPLHELTLRAQATALRAQPEADRYEAIRTLACDATTRYVALILANRVLRERQYLEDLLRLYLHLGLRDWIRALADHLTPRLGTRRIARIVAESVVDGTISAADVSFASYYLRVDVEAVLSKIR